ncbi:hypothetical protein TW80_04710 [Loktanella sp. S4079]|nr:hypothetical protein TW80_04710 [Loktanella sp. S4079]
MTHSMTAFASRTGALGAATWSWEMRAVNARGVDLRMRLPEGLDGVEQALRRAVGAVVTRGNVTVNLRVNHEETAAELVVDEARLDAVLSALDQIQDRAFAKGVTLAQPTAADVLGQRGVLVPAKVDDDNAELVKVLLSEIPEIVGAFNAMRKSEGQALQTVVREQIDQIASLTRDAAVAAQERAPQARENLATALNRVMEDITEVEEARVAQELALLAIKNDVTEEIDRLSAHVQAARDLINADGPVGRKLDFLAQEFNREANTLCAKAQSPALTAIGLDLKAVIDQMREQIQNVE